MNDGFEQKIKYTRDRSHTEAKGCNEATMFINYDNVDNYKLFPDLEDVGLTDYELIGHEMKHSYDMEFFKSERGKDPKTGIEIEEIETVNFENIIRKEEKRKERTKYGKIDIPENYLKKGGITIWN